MLHIALALIGIIVGLFNAMIKCFSCMPKRGYVKVS